MTKSPTKLAHDLLDSDEDSLEVVQVYQFKDEAAAHADDLQERITREMEAAFEQLRRALVQELGPASRSGEGDDNLIPLSGVFRFALWEINGKALFAAAAHEDRECPYLLILGRARPRSQRGDQL